MIQCKRVYEPASPADGRRVLVDRLWPRGIRKEALAMDDWLKDVAPSNEVRKQFCHDPALFDSFREHYCSAARNLARICAINDAP